MKIALDHVYFSYEEQSILQDVSLSFAEARPLVVVGTSGRGKTTILRLLAGLEKPTKGEVQGITSKTRLSIVYQEDRLFPQLTVRKNWQAVTSKLSEEVVRQMAEDLQLLPEDLDKLPKDLSGGMKRRAAIGRSLLFPADVYLMDEPFQGLDESTRAKVTGTIRKYTKGKPLLLITHDEEDAVHLDADIFRLI